MALGDGSDPLALAGGQLVRQMRFHLPRDRENEALAFDGVSLRMLIQGKPRLFLDLFDLGEQLLEPESAKGGGVVRRGRQRSVHQATIAPDQPLSELRPAALASASGEPEAHRVLRHPEVIRQAVEATQNFSGTLDRLR
jgi:hypothetical protein